MAGLGVKSFEVRIKGQHCPFRVNFNKSAQLEMFQFTKAKFNHSHPLNEPKMMVDGKEYAKHQRDLKDSKVACIEQLSLCYLSIPIFQTCLERIFPGRTFDKSLLTRMSNMYLDQKLGKDSHNLSALAKLSKEIIRDGGIFRIVMDPNSTGIQSIHVQKKQWKDYTIMQGNTVLMDQRWLMAPMVTLDNKLLQSLGLY
jgi:hypothetical protein